MLRSRRFWLGIFVSVLLLWLALRSVPFDDLEHSLMDARYLWLLPAVALQLLSVVPRAWRWVVLIEKEKKLADSFWAHGVGYLFTNVFPLRLGDPARVLIMSERCGLPVMQVAGSAIVERLLDVATILLALVLLLPWMQVPPIVAQAGLSFGIFSLLTLMLLLIAVRYRQRSESLLRLVCRRIPHLSRERIVTWWGELTVGLDSLVRRKVALRAVTLSLVSWILTVSLYWCVLRSFQALATVVEATFMVVALSLVMTLPSSPGFVGVFHFVGQQALVLPFAAKYDATNAFAITLTAHFTYYLVTTSLGAAGLWRFGESFSHLGRAITRALSSRHIV